MKIKSFEINKTIMEKMEKGEKNRKGYKNR